MAKNKDGECAYCLEYKKLCKSHAIPNKYIKNLKIEGKSVRFDEASSKTFFSGGGGDAPLLCSNCESTLNVLYDAPFQKIIDNLENVKFLRATDSKQLGISLISIAWRASLLKTDLYSGFNLHEPGERIFKKIIQKQVKSPESLYSLRVLYIFDNTFNGEVNPKSILTAPRIRFTEITNKRHLLINFMIHGFMFELWFPRVHEEFHEQLNIINFEDQIHKLKAMRLSDVPDFIKMVDNMNRSIDTGNATQPVMMMLERGAID